MKARADDWTAIVRAHWRQVTAYIVSSHHPSCIRMAKDEVTHIQRVMQWIALDGIAALRPARRWFMAVIICPGDDLAPLAKWAKGRAADRIHFYLHADADPQQLAPWRDAGLPLDHVEEQRFRSFGPMHARLGLALSDRVYGDFAP